jgi:hypothetical protein
VQRAYFAITQTSVSQENFFPILFFDIKNSLCSCILSTSLSPSLYSVVFYGDEKIFKAFCAMRNWKIYFLHVVYRIWDGERGTKRVKKVEGRWKILLIFFCEYNQDKVHECRVALENSRISTMKWREKAWDWKYSSLIKLLSFSGDISRDEKIFHIFWGASISTSTFALTRS